LVAASPSPSINLNPPAGSAGASVTVTGTGFTPSQTFSIDWDNNSSRVLASVKSDGSGNFSKQLQVPDDKVGAHTICISQPPSPCGQFTLQAKPPPPSPSPSPIPSPTPSPSPSPTPSPTALPPVADQTARANGLSLLFQPPFVFFP